jgi:hypothetical protein
MSSTNSQPPLDLEPIKAKIAEYKAELARPKQADGIGDRERASLYALNLVAFMGEAYVPRLVREVERLRAELEARR